MLPYSYVCKLESNWCDKNLVVLTWSDSKLQATVNYAKKYTLGGC